MKEQTRSMLMESTQNLQIALFKFQEFLNNTDPKTIKENNHLEDLRQGFKAAVEIKRASIFRLAYENIPAKVREEILSEWEKTLSVRDKRFLDKIIDVAWKNDV